MNFAGLSKIGFAAWALVTGLFMGVTGFALWRGFEYGNLALTASAALTAFSWGGILIVRFGGRQ